MANFFPEQFLKEMRLFRKAFLNSIVSKFNVTYKTIYKKRKLKLFMIYKKNDKLFVSKIHYKIIKKIDL